MSKNPDAFRTISEVADELDLPQHVLRFWETRFSQIKPMKRGGGRRYYRRDDIDLLRGIKALLYDEGYTIRGVQRLLKEQGNKLAVEFGKGEVPAGVILDQSETGAADQAASVSPVTPPSAKGKKPRGILGRLTGQTERDEPPIQALETNDLKTLQATLQELLECKRLLDQTRQG